MMTLEQQLRSRAILLVANRQKEAPQPSKQDWREFNASIIKDSKLTEWNEGQQLRQGPSPPPTVILQNQSGIPNVEVAAPRVDVAAPSVRVDAPNVNVQAPTVNNTVDVTALASVLSASMTELRKVVADAMAGQEEMLSQLVQVISAQKRPVVKFEPTISVPEVPVHPPRSFEITHEDGTKSTVTEK